MPDRLETAVVQASKRTTDGLTKHFHEVFHLTSGTATSFFCYTSANVEHGTTSYILLMFSSTGRDQVFVSNNTFNPLDIALHF